MLVEELKEAKELEQIVSAPDAHPHHVRFSDAIWYDPGYISSIFIGGAGGIGSWLSLALSRAGYRLIIADHDSIDETNMAGQFYPSKAIGTNKAAAVSQLCIEFGSVQRPLNVGRITEETHIRSSVVMSAFDNMKARELLFNKWNEGNIKPGLTIPPRLFVDGRMLAETGMIYFVTPETADRYKTQLFDDKDVQDQPCSMKATTHCGMHIASIMVAGLTNWISNLKLDGDIREVPFKLEFELPLLNWTTKTAIQCQPL